MNFVGWRRVFASILTRIQIYECRGLVKIMLTVTSRTEYGLWYHPFPAKCVSGL